jgi:hypothetical protein
MSVLVGRSDPEGMDVCPEGEPKRTERDSQCYVQSRRKRRVLEAKAFVADMGRAGNGADHPSRQTPQLCMILWHGKYDTNERVHDAEDYHRTKLRLPT